VSEAALLELLAGRKVETVPRLALQADEAAEAIGVSKRSFYEHVAAELPVIRRGRLRLYPVAGLERWVVENAEQVLR
jgi:hypothetical protein